MPADELNNEPRRKRAKIVSACSECRRKKTKCHGEQPCRNCQKAAVPCIYPSANSDEKRNAHNKAALDAIEVRLKAIEDMLRTILQSRIVPTDLDPVAVHNFLNRDKHVPSSPILSSSTSSAPAPAPPVPAALPSSLAAAHVSATSNPGTPRSIPATTELGALSPPSSTAGSCSSNLPPPSLSSASHDFRLPSIHNLSAPTAYAAHLAEPKHEQRDLPPLGFQSPPRPYPYVCRAEDADTYPFESDEYVLHPIKKRKR
ncbi:uncharacterized protein BYT42DRAFT_574981 [Radiomyces spectabilis]|uniref:uncharacterized protein n=1 Tax=Radiomyces spectabilis TaxID=64574 RepID=UPI002220D32D|nr:uncharacterized protein BYT42DRAFT_574981 [Radiomyces spectabilis]KAI8376543.1 hypothetical protein BYT42DRAFT_574981 [Radiomyces spectabilis]